MSKKLQELMRRAEMWPEAAQEELFEVGLEIEAEHKSGTYHPTVEELAAIDEALEQIERGEVISQEQAEAAFARFRRV